MEPTLRSGDRLLIRHGQRPRPGQIAVVRLPERGLGIKRVAHHNDGGWWVERDNPSEGVDSWLVGSIPDDDVLAVAVARIWPRPTFMRSR
jgi:hypothetical protein